MSAFGGRVPPIIQQPYAQPDASNVGLDFGRGLAEALGVVSNTLQSQGQAVAQKAENAQMAQRLKVGETEIEQAKTQLDIARQRRANLDVHLQTEEEKAKGDQLANLELFGVRAALAGMPEDKQAQWLAEHPVHDAKNASIVARSLGDSLAASKMTEVFQAIAENPENINLTELVTSKMAGIPFAQLHPEAAMEFRDSLLTRAVGYKTQQINNLVSAREAEGRQKAVEKAQTRVMMNLHDDTVPDPSDPMSFWQAVTDAQQINRKDTSATAIGEAAAEYVANALDNATKIANGDPSELIRISEWLGKATKGDDMQHRAMREKLTALGVPEMLKSNAKTAVYKQQDAAVKDFRQTLTDAAEAVNIPKMRMMEKDAIALGQQDFYKAKTDAVMAQDAEMQAFSAYVFDGGDKPANLSEGTVNQIYKKYDLAFTLQNTGTVPTDFTKELKAKISIGDMPHAAADVKALYAFDPAEADRLLSAMDGADTLRVFGRLTMGMDANSPDITPYVNNLVNNPNARIGAQLAMSKMEPKQKDDGTVIAAQVQPIASIGGAFGATEGVTWFGFGANPGPTPSPESINAFKDFYAYRTIKAINEAGGDTSILADETVLGAILSDAQADLKRNFVNLNGTLVAANTFGIGSEASPVPDATKNLQDALANFNARNGNAPRRATIDSAGFVQYTPAMSSDTKVMVDKAVTIGGKAYVPSVVTGDDGEPKVDRYMVWDIDAQKATEFIADKPGKANAEVARTLRGIFDGKIDKRELDPLYPIMWKPEYGTRSVQEMDTLTSGKFSRNLQAAVVDFYLRNYGPLPTEAMRNSDSPLERQSYINSRKTLAKIAEWLPQRCGWSLE